MRCLLSLLLLLCQTAVCRAQHWRIELAGGAGVPADIIPDKTIKPVPSPYVSYAPRDIPSEFGTIGGTSGLRLMRRDSAIEYGIGVNIFPIHFRGVTAVDTGYAPGNKTVAVSQETYLARPAIPVRGFINYCHHRSKAHAFIGLSAGIVVTRGRDMQDANTLRYDQDFTIYFHNAVGYTIGAQLGFRRCFGRFDAGMELAANFIHLSLKQGTSNTAYSYNIFYLPVQAYVGYSF